MRTALTTSLVVAACLPAHADGVGQDSLDMILARIMPPTFPDLNFSVADFGAVGDGAADDAGAFRRAIQACNAAKGGTVLVPSGTYWHAGPLDLLSDVHLHLADQVCDVHAWDR